MPIPAPGLGVRVEVGVSASRSGTPYHRPDDIHPRNAPTCHFTRGENRAQREEGCSELRLLPSLFLQKPHMPVGAGGLELEK